MRAYQTRTSLQETDAKLLGTDTSDRIEIKNFNGYGVKCYGSGAEVAHVYAHHNHFAGIYTCADETSIHDNTSEYNDANGIDLQDQDDNTVSSNTVRYNGSTHYDNDRHGILLFGDDNLVENNYCCNNYWCGIKAAGNRNIIRGNQCKSNGDAGISLHLASGAPAVTDNKIYNNDVETNGTDGIEVYREGTNSMTGNEVGVDSAPVGSPGNYVVNDSAYGIHTQGSLGTTNKVHHNTLGYNSSGNIENDGSCDVHSNTILG